MKAKTLSLLFMFMCIGLIQLSAQTFQKGAVLAVSVYTLTLNPDVTMNQFLDFYKSKYIPEFEKNNPGVKEFVLSGNRGDNKNQFGIMDVFESVAVRDKYYPIENDTATSAAAKTAQMKMKVLNDEFGKYILDAKRAYTDWIIK
jgi:hypothetical protein